MDKASAGINLPKMGKKRGYKGCLSKKLEANIRFLNKVSPGSNQTLSKNLKSKFTEKEQLETNLKHMENVMPVTKSSKTLSPKWQDQLKYLCHSRDTTLEPYEASRYQQREYLRDTSCDQRYPGSLSTKLESNLQFLDKGSFVTNWLSTSSSKRLTDKWKANLQFLNKSNTVESVSSHQTTNEFNTIVPPFDIETENKDQSKSCKGYKHQKSYRKRKGKSQCTETLSQRWKANLKFLNVDVQKHAKENPLSEITEIRNKDMGKAINLSLNVCDVVDAHTAEAIQCNAKQDSNAKPSKIQNEENEDILDSDHANAEYGMAIHTEDGQANNIKVVNHLVDLDLVDHHMETVENDNSDTMLETVESDNADAMPTGNYMNAIGNDGTTTEEVSDVDVETEVCEMMQNVQTDDTFNMCRLDPNEADWVETRMQEITTSAIGKLLDTEADYPLLPSLGETSEIELHLIATARTVQEHMNATNNGREVNLYTGTTMQQMKEENNWVLLRTILAHYGATQEVYLRLKNICSQSNLTADRVVSLFLYLLCREVSRDNGWQLPNSVLSVYQISKYCD